MTWTDWGAASAIGDIYTFDTIEVTAPPQPKKAKFKNPGVLINGVNPNLHDDCVGNPIIPSTGNKIEVESDFASAGEFGLFLTRTYNHYWSGVGLFGKHWLSNFDYKLTFGGTSVDACYPRPGGGMCSIGTKTEIYAWRPDGRIIKYVKAADGVFYEDKPVPISRIMLEGTTFVLYSEDNDVEVYSSSGYISSVRNQQGIGWTYSYNGTYPARVTHTSGRYVEFGWSGGQLTSVRDPAGNYYGYAYNANFFGTGQHRLTSSSRPGTPATSFVYHYEISGRPGALTGKTINGQRYSTFTYDNYGRATSTSHNGWVKHSLAYADMAEVTCPQSPYQ